MIVFLSVILLVLLFVMKPFGLYVSVRDTLVELGRIIHVVVKKENKLLLAMGNQGSTQRLQKDNYIVNLSGTGVEKFYFTLINPEQEEVYKSVRLFITFLDENTKVDREDSKDSAGWTMFQSNNFNYGPIPEILPNIGSTTGPIFFQFPKKKTYTFNYALYADGYEPKTGFKNIIVQ